MRKLIILITAAALCGLAASAQEVSSDSSDSGNDFEMSAVARFDVNPYFPLKKDSGYDFSFGNTSIYTFIDGSFGSGWFYSVSNHWLGVDWYRTTTEGDSVTPLYSSTWRSDANDWIDWALIGYSLETAKAGTWEFSAGKDMMAIGLTELEDNDVDCHYDLSSWYWNNYAYAPGSGRELCQGSFYQWGASVGWTSASQATSFKLQFSSSPFSRRPYNDFRKAVSFLWTEEVGCWRGMFSGNAMESYKYSDEMGSGVKASSAWWKCVALGQRFTFDALSFCLDGMFRSFEWHSPDNQVLLTFRAQYDFGDKVSLFAKAGYEVLAFNPREKDTPAETVLWGGAGVHYYPLRNSKALRIHTVVAASDGMFYAPDQLSVNVGVTYSLDFKELFGK